MQNRATVLLERRRNRSRQKSVSAALSHLDASLPGRFKGKAWAQERIRAHRTPMAEAKRLIEWLRRQDVAGAGDAENTVDHSEVQELRIRVIRKRGLLDHPQALALARLDRLIAGGGLDRQTFKRIAGAVLAMPCALGKKAGDVIS